MTAPSAAPRSTVPILGAQSPIARTALIVVVALALGTIVGHLLLPDLPPTLVFGLAAISILGLAWLIGQAAG
jgi:hypothetical protein